MGPSIPGLGATGFTDANLRTAECKGCREAQAPVALGLPVFFEFAACNWRVGLSPVR